MSEGDDVFYFIKFVGREGERKVEVEWAIKTIRKLLRRETGFWRFPFPSRKCVFLKLEMPRLNWELHTDSNAKGSHFNGQALLTIVYLPSYVYQSVLVNRK